jgi:hypothetical protein
VQHGHSLSWNSERDGFLRELEIHARSVIVTQSELQLSQIGCLEQSFEVRADSSSGGTSKLSARGPSVKMELPRFPNGASGHPLDLGPGPWPTPTVVFGTAYHMNSTQKFPPFAKIPPLVFRHLRRALEVSAGGEILGILA